MGFFTRRNMSLTAQEEGDEILKFAHFKRRIIGTSAYSESSDYELLYSKIRELLRSLLGRHRNTLFPKDAQENLRESPELFLEVEGASWRVRRDLQIETVDSPMVMALAMYSFLGAESIDGRLVAQNRFFANRAIERLVAVHDFAPAKLAKALILMYGFQEYLPPQTSAARAAFESYGFSDRSVQDEISSLPELAKLESLRPKGGIHVSNTWRTNAELEAALREYHPANRNG